MSRSSSAAWHGAEQPKTDETTNRAQQPRKKPLDPRSRRGPIAAMMGLMNGTVNLGSEVRLWSRQGVAWRRPSLYI